MSTAYSFNSTAPKDAGGQKFIFLISAETSSAEFALFKGIGASFVGGQSASTAHLAVGTHVQGSAIEPLHPFVAIGGPHIENVGASTPASATDSGSGQIVAVSNWNELHVRGAFVQASQVSTSANLIKNGSGIIFGFHVACSEIGHGDVFRLRDGTRDVLTIIAGSAFGVQKAEIPEGGIPFTTTIAHAQTVSTGAASVTVMYR